jgi:hypothetical protein
MASPRTPRSKAEQKYSAPIVQILAGDPAKPFQVHCTTLEKTAFFDIHGFPDYSPSSSASPPPSDSTLSQTQVKIENSDNETDIATTSALPIHTKIYRLKGLIYEPAAFGVIVDYLYNEYPVTPRHSDQLRVLRKAYVLALQYQVEDLQDHIVDCFRNFHTAYSVHFDDLVWLTKHISGGDHFVCQVPMVQYLVEQCAYEICNRGYDEFAGNNISFEPFLVKGDHVVRKELVNAMAKMATATELFDPARGVNRWRARDWPKHDTDAAAPEIDVIDIED